MSAVSLRPARPGDAEAVFEMLRALAQAVGEGEQFSSTLDDVRRDGFGPRPLYETVIAELAGQAAGLITVFATYSTYKGRPCLYVNDIYVEPAARRWRVGRLLMAEVARIALARDCCRVELKVLAGNPAQRFYRAIGMDESAERAYTIREAALERLAWGD